MPLILKTTSPNIKHLLAVYAYKLIDYNQSAKTFFRKFSSKTFKRGKIFEPDDEQIKSEWYSYFKKVLKGKDFTLTRKYNYESKERVDGD